MQLKNGQKWTHKRRIPDFASSSNDKEVLSRLYASTRRTRTKADRSNGNEGIVDFGGFRGYCKAVSFLAEKISW